MRILAERRLADDKPKKTPLLLSLSLHRCASFET